MKSISLFATPKTTLSANEMKQLKGGGNCGYLPPSLRGLFPTPVCGLTEEQAQQKAQFGGGGSWCCNDCSTRSDALRSC